MKKVPTLWDEMQRMQEQMDSIFENFFRGDPFLGYQYSLEEPNSNKQLTMSNYKQPLSDIYETDKNIVAEVEMPGVNKKDIKVNVSDQGIDIRAETHAETKKEDKKKGIYRFERNYSGFYRHFNLPNNVNLDKTNAEYKDGILKITVPKLKIEEQKKKMLPIK